MNEYGWLKNYWLGSQELVIVYRGGTHHVLDSYENYESVYSGFYKDCIKYCENMEIEYLESLF